MITATKSITALPAWDAVSAHFEKVVRLHLRQLLAQDPKRGEADFQTKLLSPMHCEFGGHLQMAAQ